MITPQIRSAVRNDLVAALEHLQSVRGSFMHITDSLVKAADALSEPVSFVEDGPRPGVSIEEWTAAQAAVIATANRIEPILRAIGTAEAAVRNVWGEIRPLGMDEI